MENHKEKLRIYVEEQKERKLPEVRERYIDVSLESDLIVDIVGPRRAGKTYLMFLTMKKLISNGVSRDNIIYVNFESRKLLPLTSEYLNDMIEIIYEDEKLDKGKVYLFLDEVQRVEQWERYVRSIYDEFKGRIKIFVSGSTSKLTESDLSSLLTGRHLTSYVLPLSLGEAPNFKVIDWKGTHTEQRRVKIEKVLSEYLHSGGFPEVVLSGRDEILETLFMDIINRDISQKVRKREIIEDIAYFLCSQATRQVSFSKLSGLLGSRGIKVSVPTLERYFFLMKNAFLFFDNKIFSYKVKEQLQYPRKIYCIDNGFINFFGFKFSRDAGRILENTVAINLLRQSLPDSKKKLFYYKSKQGYEVDFVVQNGTKVEQLIQVCYNVEGVETKDREIRGLIHGSKELKCDNLLVITGGYEGDGEISWFGTTRRIVFTPLWKWLLS